MAKDLQISVLLDFYGEMLTQKQRDMIDFYYNNDLSLSEIAENEGITRQGVRDAIKRAEVLLLDMEKRLGLAKRFTMIKEGLESILLESAAIDDLNNRSGGPREIRDRIMKITAIAGQLHEVN